MADRPVIFSAPVRLRLSRKAGFRLQEHSLAVNGLPAEVRAEHRGYWREIRKWERRITRTSDEFKIAKMRNIRDKFVFRLNRHWDREIKPRMLTPEKPEGLDAFMEEVGL